METEGRKRQHILIIEDDKALAAGLCRALQSAETSADSCGTLQEADRRLKGEGQQASVTGYDLVLLDVNLPDGNGLDFLQEIKAKYGISVILLTANDMEIDIVTGLELGADDYITKPFSLAVLRARVATQLRRAREQAEAKRHAGREQIIEIDEYRFDFGRMEYYRGNMQVELSRTEQKLLRILVENRGISLTRERLLERIWSSEAEFVDENALSVTVKRLRDKLGAQERIRTVYGVGYRFE
ncbi:MAG: response regulator transcription factor [Lachnospiraceae bacterium]